MDRQSGLEAIRTLDYTMLLCDDIARMRSFYAEVLRLPIIRELPGRYVEFSTGATVLALRRRGRPYDGTMTEPRPAAVQLAFRVPPDEVDVAAQQLVDSGIELLEPVRELDDFGHRVFFFADPESNIVEIYAEV